MKSTSFIFSLLAVSFIGGAALSVAQAANLGGAARGGDGGGSSSNSGPSGGSSPASSGNANFNNGSAYVLPPDCRRTENCKPPVRILPKVVELPVTKCQLERLVQIGMDPFGAPLFVRKRDCDRVLIQ